MTRSTRKWHARGTIMETRYQDSLQRTRPDLAPDPLQILEDLKIMAEFDIIVSPYTLST
jgi:hypothetical protein